MQGGRGGAGTFGGLAGGFFGFGQPYPVHGLGVGGQSMPTHGFTGGTPVGLLGGATALLLTARFLGSGGDPRLADLGRQA